MSDTPPNPKEAQAELAQRRNSVRLTTVFGGRISQHGRAYACVVSDVSAGGAKVKLKNPHDYELLSMGQPVQLVFERLSDYKALNGDIAWSNPKEAVVGITFTDPELRRRVVMKRLMPTRWKIANEQIMRETTNTSAEEPTD